MRGIAIQVIAGLDEGYGNGPSHGHTIAGIWDSDNGADAGKACEWCAQWLKFRTYAGLQPDSVLPAMAIEP